MGDRYHYDRKGKYKGHSSNKGPYEDLVKVVIFIAVLVFLSRGCR